MILDRPRRLAQRVVPIAVHAVAVGFVLGFWGQDFLPGVFYNQLPLPVVAGVVSAILYGVAATLWRPPQGARAGTAQAETAQAETAQPGAAGPPAPAAQPPAESESGRA